MNSPEVDKFVTTSILAHIANIPDVVAEAEVPRREYDLIEFLKKVKKDKNIIGVEIDYENHIISFAVVPKNE